MSTNCTCTPSYPKQHMKQWASMHELDICDGALVWLAAPSNQIAEETLYLPSISTISGSAEMLGDRKSTRLNSSHTVISYAVFCLKKKKNISKAPQNTCAMVITRHLRSAAVKLTY